MIIIIVIIIYYIFHMGSVISGSVEGRPVSGYLGSPASPECFKMPGSQNVGGKEHSPLPARWNAYQDAQPSLADSEVPRRSTLKPQTLQP